MNKLPKFALANNLYLGPIPKELQHFTSIEQVCIANARIKMNIYKFNTYSSGKVLKFRGNVIAFPQDPKQLLNILPDIPDSETYQILFVGNDSISYHWMMSLIL